VAVDEEQRYVETRFADGGPSARRRTTTRGRCTSSAELGDGADSCAMSKDHENRARPWQLADPPGKRGLPW